MAGIIWGCLELALASERSAFEEKADALVEEKAKEMMKKIDAKTYKIEKRIDDRGGRHTLEYTVTFDKYKPAEIHAGVMPTVLLDVFSNYTPRLSTDWDRQLEVDREVNRIIGEELKKFR